MPRFLMNDTTMMNSLSSSDSESRQEKGMGHILLHPSTSLAGPSRPPSHPKEPLKDKDLQKRIAQLEKDLQARTAALSDALADLAISRKEYAFLAKKMSELESEYNSPTTTPPKEPIQKQEQHHDPPYKGYFVEHLEDDDDDAELKRHYADVYDAMGLTSGWVNDSSGIQKPAPRN